LYFTQNKGKNKAAPTKINPHRTIYSGKLDKIIIKQVNHWKMTTLKATLLTITVEASDLTYSVEKKHIILYLWT